MSARCTHSLLALLVTLGVSATSLANEVELGAPVAVSDESLAELEDVDVEEKLGAELPLDLAFTDETGAPIVLGDLFEDGRPAILTFNYSNCPLLCSVQLGGLVDALGEMSWSAGKEFRVITVAVDPRETHSRAMSTKLGYLARYDRESADRGWRFLTGEEANIEALAESVGFGYSYLEAKDQYLHPAVVMMISPRGKVSTYVYGVRFDPKELRANLEIAAVGGTTEATKKFILSCYHYEATTGFAAVALKVMRYGGLAFVVGLIAVFGVARVRDRSTSPPTEE